MDVHVECFGAAARLAGREHRLRLEPGASIAEALAALLLLQPALAAIMPSCACAVGDRIVQRNRPLAAGERLALLPPVSGG